MDQARPRLEFHQRQTNCAADYSYGRAAGEAPITDRDDTVMGYRVYFDPVLSY
jgi:hypothetical protein